MPEFKDDLENIVLSGGGLRGIAYVGVLRALEEFGLSDQIKCYAGASIGGIAAALMSLGYTYSELYDFVKNFEYDLVSDIQLMGILTNFGLETGLKIERFLQALIHRKTAKREFTFKEHHQLTGKILVINATCLSTGKVEHFSAVSHPDMPVYLALRMTISIPILIAPVKYNDKLYADGGMLENFPLKLFPADKTLGIRFSRSVISTDSIDSFETYCVRTLSCVYREMNRLKDESITGYKQIVITLPLSTFQFQLDKKTRKMMYREGYIETRKRLLELGFKIKTKAGLVQSLITEIDIAIDNNEHKPHDTGDNRSDEEIHKSKARRRSSGTDTIINRNPSKSK